MRWRYEPSRAPNHGLLCKIRSVWVAENITWGIVCKPRASRAKSTLASVSHQPCHLSCSTSKSSDTQTEIRMSKDFRINPERRDSTAFPFHKENNTKAFQRETGQKFSDQRIEIYSFPNCCCFPKHSRHLNCLGTSLKALEVRLGIWDTCSALRVSFPAELPWSQESWELPAKVYCQGCITLSSLFHWAGIDPAELLEISSVFLSFACFNIHHISKQQHFFQTEIQIFRQLCS